MELIAQGRRIGKSALKFKSLLNHLKIEIEKWKASPYTSLEIQIQINFDSLFIPFLEQFCNENSIHLKKTMEGFTIWGNRNKDIVYIPQNHIEVIELNSSFPEENWNLSERKEVWNYL